MKKNKIWKGILITSVIGALLCAGAAAMYVWQNHQAQLEYERLQKEMETREAEAIAKLEFTGESDGEETVLPEDIFLDMENPIDFEKLQEINEDIYAWIRIPNTNIDYPIVQREGDPAFYLRRDIYKKPKVAGSIFTEDCNSKDFEDPHTVIYGHNMKNTSMFQNLHLYEDPVFFEENPYVYIYTPDSVRVYQIFAAYDYDDRHLMHSFDFEDEEVFAQYLKDIFNVRTMNRNLREDVELTAQDRIVTLETCIKGQTKARYLVQAVLIKNEQTVNDETEKTALLKKETPQ